jgi:hypothetical protein
MARPPTGAACSRAEIEEPLYWLIEASAYHLMTHVTARVDRVLLGRL